LCAINNILYVGGDFTSVNGNAWNRIAQFNITTQTWSSPFGTGLNNICLAFYAINNILYVGGKFTSPYLRIATWNITTQVWSNPFGTGANNEVWALYGVGSIVYIGGIFTSVNGII
jgi:hypothetical protein